MLYRSPAKAGKQLNRPVTAVGNFDGVHRGHQAVIEQLVDAASERGVDAAVLTFEPHPVRFFKPEAPEFRLTTLEQKSALLHELGVDGVVGVDFDRELSTLTPAEFVDDVLHRSLRASGVLVGVDFRFGRGRAGDIETLKKLCAARGIDVLAVEQVEADGEPISSTRIRDAVAEADLETARELLGRPFAIRGTVAVGDGKGRDYGFPTANIETGNRLLPPDGIYATRLHDADEGTFDAATYVGTRPTVGGTTRNVEAHCLDAPDDLLLYGHVVALEFIARVRGDEHFENVEEMIEQMHRDVRAVRKELSG